MRRALALSFLLLVAAQTPVPSEADPRVRTVLFVPDKVVRLQGALGWQIMIEFAPDERIENVSIGDALAWQVTPNKRARNLFLKPLVKNGATNMTVVTDRRRYVFSLETAARLSTIPWVVRFDYPQEVVESIEEPLPPPPPPLNFAYTIYGDEPLRPLRVWDDGRMTYFEFPASASIPAIFASGPGKTESLVNSLIQGRVVVVQQTAGRFTLRTGRQIATVDAGTGKGK